MCIPTKTKVVVPPPPPVPDPNEVLKDLPSSSALKITKSAKAPDVRNQALLGLKRTASGILSKRGQGISSLKL